MAGKVDQLAVQDGGDLVDTVGHHEATVEDRDFRLGLGQVVAVQIDGAGHFLSLKGHCRRICPGVADM